MTPVATVGDRDFALGFCNELNLRAPTNRWTIAPGHYGGDGSEILWVSCSFVAGSHNQDALRGFATIEELGRAVRAAFIADYQISCWR
jgi:hypothetical protein